MIRSSSLNSGKNSIRKYRKHCHISELYQRNSRNTHKSAFSLTINKELNARTTRESFIRNQQSTKNRFNSSRERKTTIETTKIDTKLKAEYDKKQHLELHINQTTNRKNTIIKTTLNQKIRSFRTTDT